MLLLKTIFIGTRLRTLKYKINYTILILIPGYWEYDWTKHTRVSTPYSVSVATTSNRVMPEIQ